MAKKITDRIVWLGVFVKNFQAQRRFYRDVLGMKELKAGDGWAHFKLGTSTMLELMLVSPEPPHQRKGFRPGFQVKDIKAARRELIERGAEPGSGIKGGKKAGGFWCSFKDADDNYFEIKQVIVSSSRRAAGGSSKRRGKK